MASGGRAEEIVELLALVWPTYLAVICEVGLTTSAAVFLGHYGEDASVLAGSYLAISVFNIIASAPIAGLASALDTLSSQAFGAHQYMNVGVFLQRGLIVNLMFSCLVLPILLYPHPILKILLGKGNTKVMQVAEEYLRWYAWGIFPLGVFDALRRYLITQHIVRPLLLASACGLIANISLHYLLVVMWDLQHIGSAIAMFLSLLVSLTALVYIVIRQKIYDRTWPGVQIREAFKDLKPYLALGVPGVIQVCSEWWCFEATLFVLARWDEATLAAHVAMMNLVFIGYILPMSIGTAAAVRVGNAIGAGDRAGAKLARSCSILLAFCSALLESGIIVLGRHVWPYVYTSIPAVSSKLVAVAPVFALFSVSDNLQGALGGVLRGCGRQTLGAMGNVIAFWMLGIPLGAWLCWRADDGIGSLRGMWGGLAISEWMNVAVMLVFIAKMQFVETEERETREEERRLIPKDGTKGVA